MSRIHALCIWWQVQVHPAKFPFQFFFVHPDIIPSLLPRNKKLFDPLPNQQKEDRIADGVGPSRTGFSGIYVLSRMGHGEPVHTLCYLAFPHLDSDSNILRKSGSSVGRTWALVTINAFQSRNMRCNRHKCLPVRNSRTKLKRERNRNK
jgi:hypothetical protein